MVSLLLTKMSGTMSLVCVFQPPVSTPGHIPRDPRMEVEICKHFFKHVLAPSLLLSRWPKQVTWLIKSKVSVGDHLQMLVYKKVWKLGISGSRPTTESMG